MRLSLLWLVVYFVTSSVLSQEHNYFRGKLVSSEKIPAHVSILNLVTERETKSDDYGLFSIEAKIGDLLIVSDSDYEYKRKVLREEDFTGAITIELVAKPIELQEVIVNDNSGITAEKLGIIPANQKKYTPAERKLATASSFSPGAGGSIGLDPLLNAISGRTTMLRKELKTERKEFDLEKLKAQYPDEFYTEDLKIPADHISGFQYYLIENQNFATALHRKNKTLMRFLCAELSQDYLKTLDDTLPHVEK